MPFVIIISTIPLLLIVQLSTEVMERLRRYLFHFQMVSMNLVTLVAHNYPLNITGLWQLRVCVLYSDHIGKQQHIRHIVYIRIPICECVIHLTLHL